MSFAILFSNTICGAPAGCELCNFHSNSAAPARLPPANKVTNTKSPTIFPINFAFMVFLLSLECGLFLRRPWQNRRYRREMKNDGLKEPCCAGAIRNFARMLLINPICQK
jgi:hypothetical protein